MIANGLLLQTEFPPLLDDIKRALLTYDHVYLYAPDDRDIMPSELYNAAAFGLPMGFGGVPVRPLGKVIDYDDAFQRTVEQCEAAFDQGCLSILPCAAPHVDPTMQGARLVLGTPPTPPNQPNPQRLLGYYRALATLSSMVTGIGRSLDALPLLTDANVERIAPKGIDDQKVTFEVVGATQKTSLPAVALYEGFAHTDDERVVLTRICLARLAALVRALAHCEMLGLQPYTTDVGYSSVLQQLSANARDAIVEATQDQEADIDAVAARLLSRLHNLVMSEFIDQEAVHAMSVSEVLKLRSKSWGTAGEQREAMMRSLWLLSRNAKNSEDFDQACRTTLEEYRRARSDWENEAAQLKVRFLADLGKVALGGFAGTLGAEVTQRLVNVGSFEGLLLLGGTVLVHAVEKRGPAVIKIIHQLKEVERLPGCSLARPYRPFFSI